MSRSYRKPYFKDKSGKPNYHKKIRRIIKYCISKQKLNIDLSFQLPQFKEIVNDWDFCDYSFNLEKPIDYDRSYIGYGKPLKERIALYEKLKARLSRK